jgi:hypothetical protein
MPGRRAAATATKAPAVKPWPSAEVFSDDDEGTDDQGNPTGLLKWGQAGVYNAVDDRQVITALTDNAVGGMVRPAGLSAGPGLTVNVAAGWLGVASAGDGTNVVIGSRQSHTVQETAGPVTGSRADLLWADTMTDDGRWVLRVIPESAMPGRSGLPLARITVPAGANLASQMTFSGDVHSLSPKVDSNVRNNHGVTTWVGLTPMYPFAIYGMRRDSMYRLTAYGIGDPGSGAVMRFSAGNAALDINTGSIGLGPSNRGFYWEAEAVVTFGHRYEAGVGNSKLAVTVTRSNVAAAYNSSIRGVAVAQSTQFGNSPWLWLGLDMRFLTAVPNANIVCQSSAFEAVAKPW